MKSESFRNDALFYIEILSISNISKQKLENINVTFYLRSKNIENNRKAITSKQFKMSTDKI